MNIRTHIPIALFIGFLGASIQVLDSVIYPFLSPTGTTGLSWVAFLAWATYFMSGCNIKGGFQSIVGIASGIVLSIAIIELSSQFSPAGTFAVPLSILLLVPLSIMLEKAPFPFNGVPAIFIGAGAYFALTTIFPTANHLPISIAEMGYAALGILFGWLTITGRQAYEKRLPTSM